MKKSWLFFIELFENIKRAPLLTPPPSLEAIDLDGSKFPGFGLIEVPKRCFVFQGFQKRGG